jgi:hypothetical protein
LLTPDRSAARFGQSENRLNDMVCDGEISLREAQREIVIDWVAAYQKFIGRHTSCVVGATEALSPQ